MAILHQRGWAAHAFEESPWYFPLASLWQSFAGQTQFPSPEQLSQLYRDHTSARSLPPGAARLRFVSAPNKRKRRTGNVELSSLYEGKIVELGEVPTRSDDWHDFFNALTFAVFPRAKWALHERQYRLLKQRIAPNTRRLPGARTREQDALALFDEGGIALAVDKSQVQQLVDHPESFEASVLSLCRQGAALALPFGHALPEHLVEGLPCPLGTLHPVFLEPGLLGSSELVNAVDDALCLELGDPTRFVTPTLARGLSLPVLAEAGALAAPLISPR